MTRSVRAVRGSLHKRYRALASPFLLIGAVLVIVLAVAVVVPTVYTGADPNATDLYATLQAPSLDHWFGTDQNGRDIFARTVFGARPSLLIGLGATGMALLSGIVLGTLAAAGGAVADQLASRTLDLMLAVPGLLLVFLIAAVMGTGSTATVVGLAIGATPGFARVVRAEVLRVRTAPYVETAYGLGAGYPSVVVAHIVPNAIAPVMGLATMTLGAMVVASSSLSFVGLGPKPPAAEWGAMLSAGRDYIGVAWWLTVFPGIAITLAVVVFTGVGRSLQRRFTGGAAAMSVAGESV